MKLLRFRSDSGIKFSLHTKFVTCVVILECSLMASIMLAVESRMRASLLKEFIQRGQFAARNLAAMNTNYLTTYNYVNIEQGTGKIVRQNNMNYAAVLMFNGDLAGFGGENSKRKFYLDASTMQWAMDAEAEQFRYRTVEEEPICDFVVPVKLNEQTWGKCCVGLTMKDLNAAIFQTRMVLFTLGFVALAIGCVGAMIAARRITRPVDALVTGVEAIAQGDYSRKIDITTQDEIGYLSRRFASMQDSLKDHVELLTDTNQKTDRHEHAPSNLFEASRSMNSLQNQDKLFGLILEAALTATGACQGSLFLLNGGSEPSVVATVGDALECLHAGRA